MKIFTLSCAALVAAELSLANPFPKPEQVSYVESSDFSAGTKLPLVKPEAVRASNVVVSWAEEGEAFRISKVYQDQSGTNALLRRSMTPSGLGSYRATLKIGEVSYYSSIGTGKEFRKLSRAMFFRFPEVSGRHEFVLEAENPGSGVMEEVLREFIDFDEAESRINKEVETRLVHKSQQENELVINIYSEGYLESRRSHFFERATAVYREFERMNFPMLDHLSFYATFSPSRIKFGKAVDRGSEVIVRDTFLGLDFPYWNKFGRWYHVLYPTSVSKYRVASGSSPYDYPIILADSQAYWGVGNYMELTAVPADQSRFGYLLMHEFGHFLGLNEEYEAGGRTELEFAPNIEEPWSQNITFQTENLKWHRHVDRETIIPTPASHWSSRRKNYGAYRGGYASSPGNEKSHKPGLSCVMHSQSQFCDICKEAISKQVRHDIGL